MNKPERLHPIYIFYMMVRNWHYLIVPIIVALLKGRWDKWVWMLVIWLGVYGFYVVFKWLNTKYWIQNHEIRYQEGNIKSQKIYIPLKQIQAVEIERKFWQRFFGVVTVKIETSSSSEAEMLLPTITRQKADQLKQALLKNLSKGNDSYLKGYQITSKQLLQTALTSGKWGYFLAVAIPITLKLDDLFDVDMGRWLIEWIWHTKLTPSQLVDFIWIGLLAFPIAWLGSVMITWFHYGNFHLYRDDQNMYIEKGLIHQEKLTIPIRRIQAVKLEENGLQQLFGLATIKIFVAGLGIEEKKGQVVLFPLIKKEKQKEFFGCFLPEFLPLMEMSIHPSPCRSRYYRLAITFALLIIFQGVFCFWFIKWAWFSLLAITCFLLYQWKCFKDEKCGSGLSGLVLVKRVYTKETYYIPYQAIQARTKFQHILTRELKLARLIIFLASGKVVRSGYLEQIDVERLLLLCKTQIKRSSKRIKDL
ncbi:PH domain-containing protein [Thermoflavimicrobium daqui]|nr:PH domain-containing protein [Thermoflavimicrobium daqui]